MSWIDWVDMIVPMFFVVGMGFYSRCCIKNVTDYLADGRYVISVEGLAVITLTGYTEAHYKNGRDGQRPE